MVFLLGWETRLHPLPDPKETCQSGLQRCPPLGLPSANPEDAPVSAGGTTGCYSEKAAQASCRGMKWEDQESGGAGQGGAGPGHPEWEGLSRQLRVKSALGSAS